MDNFRENNTLCRSSTVSNTNEKMTHETLETKVKQLLNLTEQTPAKMSHNHETLLAEPLKSSSKIMTQAQELFQERITKEQYGEIVSQLSHNNESASLGVNVTQPLRQKKFSHPCYFVSSVSPPITPSPLHTRRKKHSLPAITLPVPILSLGTESILSHDSADVTKSLESAVRKMSRGSSPNHLMGSSPNSRSPLESFMGLSGKD
jgi:hypothetical protein